MLALHDPSDLLNGHGRLWQTLNTPLQTFGGVKSGRGQPSRENFEPDQKIVARPTQL